MPLRLCSQRDRVIQATRFAGPSGGPTKPDFPRRTPIYMRFENAPIVEPVTLGIGAQVVCSIEEVVPQGIRPRVRRRHPDYLDFQRVLRGNLANRLLQIHARFCREICCPTWWRRRRPPGRASRSWLRPSRKQSSSSRCTTIQRSMWAPTFMEVFPIGLAVTLLSAGILRKQAGQMPA
jgi:hypothetical protein